MVGSCQRPNPIMGYPCMCFIWFINMMKVYRCTQRQKTKNGLLIEFNRLPSSFVWKAKSSRWLEKMEWLMFLSITEVFVLGLQPPPLWGLDTVPGATLVSTKMCFCASFAWIYLIYIALIPQYFKLRLSVKTGIFRGGFVGGPRSRGSRPPHPWSPREGELLLVFNFNWIFNKC